MQYNLKPKFLVLVPALFLSAGVYFSPVSAHIINGVDTHTGKRVEGEMNINTNMAINEPTRMDLVKEKVSDIKMDVKQNSADREIDRRITALNALITRINNMKRITTEQKATLTAQVQKAITDLTALKAKIDADTDPAVLKADKQSIVTSYRVFLLLMPKVEIMAHADMELQLANQMKLNDTALQTKIQAAQDAGKDVTAINKLMADRQAKIVDAQTQAQSAINDVMDLMPEGYPGNKTALSSGRDSLKMARKDLTDAYQDLVKINVALKAMNK